MSIPDPVVLLDARAKYVHPAFQMSRASTKSVFDAAGRLVTMPPNALGWDHDPATGQARGYLTEPSATNLLLHSNDLSKSYWAKFRASITPSAITGPDGSGMAKLVEDTQTGHHGVLRDILVDDTSAVAFSVILTAAERHEVNIRIAEAGGAPTVNCSYDLIAGAAGEANESGGAAALGSGIVDLGGGFYRCWIAGALGSGAMNVRCEVRMLDSGGGVYTGDGTSGLYLGYCQAEEGSYPTSYIETGAATATRAGDALTMTDVTQFPWWNSARWALIADVELVRLGSKGDVLSLNNNMLRVTTTDGNVRIAGVILGSSPIIVPTIESRRYLIGLACGANGIIGAADGKLSSLATNSPLNPSLPMGLGVRSTGAAALGGWIRRAAYYPARLSNADLQSLTAIQE